MTLVRITPSKWDAEYSWLRDETCKRSIGQSPMVALDDAKSKARWRPWFRGTGGETPVRERHGHCTLGLCVQAAGALALLALFGLEGGVPMMLCLGALLAGEVIYITSLGNGGERFRGARTR